MNKKITTIKHDEEGLIINKTKFNYMNAPDKIFEKISIEHSSLPQLNFTTEDCSFYFFNIENAKYVPKPNDIVTLDSVYDGDLPEKCEGEYIVRKLVYHALNNCISVYVDKM